MAFPAPTYSLSVTGVATHNTFALKTVKIADAQIISPQAEQAAMARNTAFIGQLPDGQSGVFVFEAERSIPGALRIVRKLYG